MRPTKLISITGLTRCAAAVIAVTLLLSTAALATEKGPMPGQRVILVTGSTGGLGRETALALAASGDHVILHGRNVERAEEVLAAIDANGNGSASFYRADLASGAEFIAPA